MLPPEDQKALRDKGFKYSGNKAISPLIRPLQNPFTKFFSSEAQPHRHREREPINNSRATQPKATPIASNTRRYGSADAEERWSSGSSPKPQLAIAPRREQNKNNVLNQTNSVIKGTLVGNAVANKKLSPTKAKDVLKLVDKSGIGKADLEPRLKASGWIEVTGRWAKKSNPTSPIGSIWTNPARDESITIRPKKCGSFGVR